MSIKLEKFLYTENSSTESDSLLASWLQNIRNSIVSSDHENVGVGIFACKFPFVEFSNFRFLICCSRVFPLIASQNVWYCQYSNILQNNILEFVRSSFLSNKKRQRKQTRKILDNFKCPLLLIHSVITINFVFYFSPYLQKSNTQKTTLQNSSETSFIFYFTHLTVFFLFSLICLFIILAIISSFKWRNGINRTIKWSYVSVIFSRI